MTELAIFADPRPHLWTTEEFEAIAFVAPFAGRTVELIEGVLFEMSPQQSTHSYVKTEVGRRLANQLETLGDDRRVYIEPTVAIPPDSAPEPDIVVTGEMPGKGFLAVEGVILLVEIANTTIEHDLGRKSSLYGRSGIPEYWVVEIDAACIHRRWSPGPHGYAEQDEVPLGQPCRSVTMPDLSIATTGLV